MAIEFSTITSRVPPTTKDRLFSKLSPELTRIKRVMKRLDYADDHASVCLPQDQQLVKDVEVMVRKKKKLQPEHIVLIGIGGSNLGTVAVQQAILSRQHNSKASPQIHYIDTVDSDHIQQTIDTVEPALKKKKNILVVSISKSGGTTETIANTQIFIELLEKYTKDYQKSMLVISDKGSKYYTLAQDLGWDVLALEQKVGGRYSVLSAVGLFPLAMLGIPIKKLLAGAADANKDAVSASFKKNYAAQSAVALFYNATKGVHIHDTFVFHSDLESLGKWYRQLMGESVGKQHNVRGKEVFAGLTPTVSVGSTDLHSVGQLYLGGPYDKFTTFVAVQHVRTPKKVPRSSPLAPLVGHIQSVALPTIMDAILQGTQTAFRKQKRPYATLWIETLDAYSIGYFLQMKMVEMMYLGYLMEVNPFDQPNVESYKVVTKDIMKSWD